MNNLISVLLQDINNLWCYDVVADDVIKIVFTTTEPELHYRNQLIRFDLCQKLKIDSRSVLPK